MGGKPSKLARDDQPSDSEAYCLPCDPDRESAPPLVGREKSIVDDHSLAWARYVHAPSTHGGAAPFNPAGTTTAVAAAVAATPVAVAFTPATAAPIATDAEHPSPNPNPNPNPN